MARESSLVFISMEVNDGLVRSALIWIDRRRRNLGNRLLSRKICKFVIDTA